MENALSAAPVDRLIRCRVSMLLILDEGPFTIERLVDLPFVPRAGDWLWDVEYEDKGCWSDAGIEIKRVGVCVSSGNVLLDCGIETVKGESFDEAIKWFQGFERV